MSAPIVLCHYGNSPYLPYVFKAMVYSNPDKQVFLLGDSTNEWIGKINGVQHIPFETLEYGEELTTFNKVYRLVKGDSSKNIRWINFVFKRWYYVYNFLCSRDVGDFWHFDSDNMILDSLSRHEHKFNHYDFTEQCNGCCMNGYVSSKDFVRDYLRKMNQLFTDEAYLDSFKPEMRSYPDHAFTEMSAYCTFRDDEDSAPINPVRLNKVVEASTFDDCICQKHGMKMELFPNGKETKLIACSDEGSFFCFPDDNSAAVRLNSINLSWVPTELFSVVLAQLIKGPPPESAEPPKDVGSLPTLTELFCQQYRFKTFFYNAKRWIRRCF